MPIARHAAKEGLPWHDIVVISMGKVIATAWLMLLLNFYHIMKYVVCVVPGFLLFIRGSVQYVRVKYEWAQLSTRLRRYRLI